MSYINVRVFNDGNKSIAITNINTALFINFHAMFYVERNGRFTKFPRKIVWPLIVLIAQIVIGFEHLSNTFLHSGTDGQHNGQMGKKFVSMANLYVEIFSQQWNYLATSMSILLLLLLLLLHTIRRRTAAAANVKPALSCSVCFWSC